MAFASTPIDALDAETGPVRPTERIAILDILRGFALFGILVMNLPGFNTPWAIYSSGQVPYPGWYNRVADWVTATFFEGKFNAIFSFLFGVGLTIQLERAAAKNTPFVRVYLRRLFTLFLFGVAHMVFLWDGDVLHMYAVLGLGLLLIRHWPDKALLPLATVILIVPVAKSSYDLYLNEPGRHTKEYWLQRATEQTRVYSSGTYFEILQTRLAEVAEGYLDNAWWIFWCSLAVTMLLGFVVGRRRIVQNLAQQTSLIRNVFNASLALGVITGSMLATFEVLADRTDATTVLGTLTSTFYQLNRPLLSMAYITGLTLLSMRPGWSERLAPLASVGRMPLTNYLMQSVICSLLFYSYGLALFGKVGSAGNFLVALAIYAFQVLYSNLWMAHFQYGPLEWLWRLLTYGKVPPMRARGATISEAG